MSRPSPSNEGPIEVRRENQVILDNSIIQEPDNAISLGSHINPLSILTEKYSSNPRLPDRLVFKLEVYGATTETAFVSACHKCSTKVPSALKDCLVGIAGEMARVAFRFRCLPLHHGTTDREYR